MTEDRNFVIRATMYLPVPGFEPMSSEFLDNPIFFSSFKPLSATLFDHLKG